MIVTCEQCQTRFQLDEAKVPEGGATVRCSRCRHAFHIDHPGFGESGTTSSLEKPDPPTAAAEQPGLEEDAAWGGGGELTEPDEFERADRSGSDGPEDDEADWRFSDELPPPADAARDAFSFEAARGAVDDLLAPPVPAADESAASEEPQAPDADAERDADPEADDFFANPEMDLPLDEGGDAPGSAPERAVIGSISLVSASEAEAASPMAAEAPIVAEEVAAPAVRPGARHAGWIAVAAIFALGLWTGIGAGAGSEAEGSSQALGTLRAVELRGRWVENAHAGMLYVVSGRLENPTAELRAFAGPLAVELLDRHGAPVPGVEAEPLRSPHGARLLGEATPDAIAAASSAPPRALRKGESRPFESVFVGLPAAAERFRIRVADPLADSSLPAEPELAPLAGAGNS